MKIYRLIVVCILMVGCQNNFTRIALEKNIEKSSLLFRKINSSNYTIYIEQNQPFVDTLYQSKVEKAMDRIKQILRIDPLDFKFAYVFVNSSNSMKLIANKYEGQGIAFVDSKVVVEQAHSNSNGCGAHELFHLIIYHHTGVLPKDGFTSEGFAVFSDDKWWGYDLHSVANYILNNKQIRILDVIQDFRRNEIVSYPISGSFIKFIYEKYGLETVLYCYKYGIINIEKVIPKKIDELEKEWRNEIRGWDYSKIDYPLNR
ncbi:MAG: hypothetical protein ACK52X_07015 [bacterium]